MKIKVLALDDEIDITAALQRDLRSNFDLIEAHSVQDAQHELEKQKDIAAIICDQNLGEVRGIDFLSSCSVSYPSVVRLLLSGQLDLEQVIKAVNEAKVHKILLKPWTRENLLLSLTEAMQLHQILLKNSELQLLSVTDPVTGLFNHRFFQERLQQEVARSIRHKRNLSILMIDVDNFKNCNDHLGHLVGDQLLRQLALVIRSTLRQIDIVARYGGDEFAVIMPETDAAKALEVAERLRAQTQLIARLMPQTQPWSVSISIGIASSPIHGDQAKVVLQAADSALYQAKLQGRNKSVVAPI